MNITKITEMLSRTGIVDWGSRLDDRDRCRNCTQNQKRNEVKNRIICILKEQSKGVAEEVTLFFMGGTHEKKPFANHGNLSAGLWAFHFISFCIQKNQQGSLPAKSIERKYCVGNSQFKHKSSGVGGDRF